jgi:hypothetical protein
VPAVADIAAREGLWLHVDAAYGGVAAIVPERREVLAGCDRADSIVVNPHKWLFTPIDCSVLYCRRPDVLKRAFTLVPSFLQTPEGSAVENYMDWGPQLGRRFRALKLWMVLRAFGRSGIAVGLAEQGATPGVARCVARLFALSPDALSLLQQASLSPDDTRRVREALRLLLAAGDERAVTRSGERVGRGVLSRRPARALRRPPLHREYPDRGATCTGGGSSARRPPGGPAVVAGDVDGC